MTHIRPQTLFSLLPDPGAKRVIQLAIPFQAGTGGLTMLETVVLLSCMRIVNAKRAFEFGTFFGRTSLNMALNLPDMGVLFTLDLPPDEVSSIPDTPDLAIANLRAQRSKPMDYEGHPEAAKIRCMEGNSRTMSLSLLFNSIDLVLIDGGHDGETVKRDSENAFRMLHHPGCVVWHDYGHPAYPDLTKYLDSLHGLYHIEETMLCVWFNDHAL